MADSLIDWFAQPQSVAADQTAPVTQGEIGRNPQIVSGFAFPPPYQGSPPSTGNFAGEEQGLASLLGGGPTPNPTSPTPPALPAAADTLPGYKEALYGRIHVIPSVSNLGNVLQQTQVQIEVWNAFEITQTLSQITGGQTGTTILEPTPPGPAPADFLPRASFLYVAQVEESGPNSVDSTFTFDFTVESPAYQLVGTRTVLIPFPAQRPVNEALEWKTDIIESYEGREQRIRTRILPRNLFEFGILESRPVARTALLNRIWGFHGRSFGIPLWHFGRPLLQDAAPGVTSISVDTANADFRASTVDTQALVILWRDYDDFEVAQVNGVNPGSLDLEQPLQQSHSAAQTEVMPLQIMLGKDPLEWSRTPNGVVSLNGSWIAESVVDLAEDDSNLTLLDGLPVLTGFNFTDELTEAFEAKYFLHDFETGTFASLPRRLIGELNTQKGFETDTDEDSWTLRKLLYALRGRQRSFWLPSWHEEFEVTEIIGAADTALTVTNAGHARFLDGAEPFSAIMLVLTDGTQFFRRITDITDNLDGTETVTIDSSLGQEIDPNELDRVSYVMRARLGSDRVEIEHTRKGTLRVTTAIIGVIE